MKNVEYVEHLKNVEYVDHMKHVEYVEHMKVLNMLNSNPQSTLICLYLLIDANVLIPFLSTVEWLFYCVTFSVILYLRYKEPNTHRPFKVRYSTVLVLSLIIRFAHRKTQHILQRSDYTVKS